MSARVVSQHQVAEHCGVSVATVSLALRHNRKISAGTIARIEARNLGEARSAAAAKLGRIRDQLGARRACILGAENGREPLAPGVERLGPAEALREAF